MRRREISFDEKVDARFVRRSKSECWPWHGSLHLGRPQLNLRLITRYIYEREIAPIPPGVNLIRSDHRPDCAINPDPCIHMRCVNPYHVSLRPDSYGLYERENPRDTTATDHIAEYKRRVRRKKKG
jgi:hypothetical protein